MTATTAAKSNILLESGTNEVEFIEFYIGDESFGVNVSKVVRVMSLKDCKITPMPGSHHAIRGTLYIQENPVPLIDLRKALSLPDLDVCEERQLVLVLSFNQLTTSYIIDGVNKIHRTSWKDFKPLSTGGFGENGYTTGSIKLKDSVVMILDIERLLLEFIPEPNHGETMEVSDEVRQKRASVCIVYCEDSKLIRKNTCKILNEAGYLNVEQFDDGQLSLNRLNELQKKYEANGSSFSEHIYVVLTDIEMPEMDGLTLCKHVKSNPATKHIPVIVYSSLINDQMIRKCQSVGADAQIGKPRGNTIIKEIDRLALL